MGALVDGVAATTMSAVVRSTDSAGRAMFGQGTWEIVADSGTRATDWLAVVANDSLSRVHVELSRGGRLIASGEGAFVTVRRDTGVVSLEARGRAPSSFPPNDLRKP